LPQSAPKCIMPQGPPPPPYGIEICGWKKNIYQLSLNKNIMTDATLTFTFLFLFQPINKNSSWPDQFNFVNTN
jgi:hypothetical protein